VVNVTDRPNIHMRLIPFEFLFRHFALCSSNRTDLIDKIPAAPTSWLFRRSRFR
jgi:hypothetical protein